MRAKTSQFKFICLLSLSVLLFLPNNARALQQEPPGIQQLLTQAREQIANKDYDEARLALKKVLRINKESAEANYLLALVYVGRYESDMASDYLQKAINLQPVYPEAHSLLAKLRYEQHDFKRAKEEVEIAIQQGGKLASLYEIKGDIELREGLFEAALESYETALRVAADKENGVNIKELENRKNVTQERVESVKKFREFIATHAQEVDQKPIPLNNPRPNYTEEARQHDINGNVRAGVLIDENGKVIHVVLFSSLGYGLDEEAICAARKLRFKPAMNNGQAVPYWLYIDIGFTQRSS